MWHQIFIVDQPEYFVQLLVHELCQLFVSDSWLTEIMQLYFHGVEQNFNLNCANCCNGCAQRVTGCYHGGSSVFFQEVFDVFVDLFLD